MSEAIRLLRYDGRFVPGVRGLENPGIAICYFNSMLQALMSCSAFNMLVLKWPAPSDVMIEYCNLLRGKTDAKNLLIMLIRKNNTLVFGQQDDMHLGLGIFLETMPVRIQNLFKLKHKSYVECHNCRTRHEVATPHEMAVTIDDVSTKEEMENAIMNSSSVISDYTCEKCNHRGDVVKRYSIARLSEIIVVILNKTRQGVKYFSPTLDFYSKPLDETLHYSVVAQVEHLGSTSGGHYYTLGKRNRIYLFDDDQIAEANAFTPTNNTYIVIYNLQ